jgi:uncharacterized protein with FMN-binding domain
MNPTQARRILALAAIIAILALLATSCSSLDIEVGKPDFSRLADGDWRGSYEGSLGSAAVSLTVAKSRVTEIRLEAFDSSSFGEPAKEAIPARVVAAQSLDVDQVSGATYSSRVILKAVEVALGKAALP